MVSGSYTERLIEAYKSTIAKLKNPTQEVKDSIKVYIAIKTINDFSNNIYEIIKVSSIVNNDIESQFGALAVTNYINSLKTNIIKYHGGDSTYADQIDQVIKGLTEAKSPEYDLLKSIGMGVNIPMLDDLIDLRNSTISLLEYKDNV